MSSSNRSYRPERGHSPISSGKTPEKTLVVFQDDNLEKVSEKPRAKLEKTSPANQPANMVWLLLGAVLPLVGMLVLLVAGSASVEGGFRERLKWMVFGMIGMLLLLLVGYLVFLVLSGATVDGTIRI